MNLSLELNVWLGTAGVALLSANLILWRTRHTLKRLRQELDVPEGRLVPAATVTEMAASVAAL